MKICIRCGNNYKRLQNHLKNKKICEAIYLDIPREKIIENYNKYYDEFIICRYNKEKNNDRFECEFCGKLYTHKTTYYKHKRLDCKVLYELINNNNNNNIQDFNEQNNEITDNNIHTNIQNHNESISYENNTTINNNIINQTINNNITINNNNINITINNFGSEKNINANEIAKILNGPLNRILPEYFKQTYIEIPENRNIYIPNIKGKYVKIYMNNKWEYQLLIPTVDNIIDKSGDYIRIYIQNCDDVLSKNNKKINYTKIKEKIYNYLDNIEEKPKRRKCVIDDIILELINGRDRILENDMTNKENLIDIII